MDSPIEENENSSVLLPTEVISYIMLYLPIADRISASQTCHQWNEASKRQKLHQNETIFIHSNISHALKYLATPNKLNLSDPPFTSFVFRDVDVKTTGEMRYFWPKYGPNMKSLTLQNCDISEKVLNDILSTAKNLKILNISSCNQLFMSGKILENTNIKMLKLEELYLTNSRYISDSILNRFVNMAPNLKSLNLDGCSISYNEVIFNRFYPQNRQNDIQNELQMNHIPLDLSNNVLTFQNILNVLKIRTNIDKLSLAHTSINSQSLKDLCIVCKNNNIISLNLSNCYQIINGLDDISNTFSSSLKYLNLSYSPFLRSLDAIPNLTALTELNLRQCQKLSNETVKNFKILKNLISIDLSKAMNVYGPSILEGLTGLPKLKHLYLNALSLMDSSSLLELLRIVPPLETLELEKCQVPVIDTALEIIYTRHTTIKRLNLASCPLVSDLGVTGMAGNMEDQQVDIPINEESTSTFKISLGSKAERQIVFEGKRQKAIEEHINPIRMQQLDDEHSELLGISKLQMLVSLDLSDCPRVTDWSVKHSCRFRQLKFLNLHNNTQITDRSLQSLAVYCPSLEELNLKGCCRITDQGVLYLSHLNRLKSLSLEGCSLLSNFSLEALMNTKSPLKEVGIQDCTKLTLDAVNIFSNWLNHSISWSENRVNNVPPPPPPEFPNNGSSQC